MVRPRTKKQYCCLIGCPIWIIVSFLVIFAPHLFYTDVNDIPEDMRSPRQNALVNLQNKYAKAGFDRDLLILNQDIDRNQQELKNLNSRKPYWGQPKPELQNLIAISHNRLRELHQHSKALQLQRDTALTQIRALTPVFSKMAFDETRELFKERQEKYAGIFCWFWKWDAMWSLVWAMPSGGNDGGEWILRAILDLMYKLTMGTMMALGDFACRLPFWIKEYQIFTPNDLPQDYFETNTRIGAPKTDADEDDAYERMRRKHEGESDEDDTTDQNARTTRGQKYEEEEFDTVAVVGSSGGWMATFSGTVFWMMAFCAASGATVGLILLIWSPLIILVIISLVKNRGNLRSSYSSPYHEHYD